MSNLIERLEREAVRQHNEVRKRSPDGLANDYPQHAADLRELLLDAAKRIRDLESREAEWARTLAAKHRSVA